MDDTPRRGKWCMAIGANRGYPDTQNSTIPGPRDAQGNLTLVTKVELFVYGKVSI